MSIYDANYYEIAANEVPPNKRLPVYLTWVFVLVSAMNWLHDVIFNVWKKGGESYPVYSAGTFDKYERVIYNKGVYESLIDSNTDLPSVTTSWIKLTDSFIGVDERILFGTSKLTLEYALNKWFFTEFRQPNFDDTSISDIYIETNEVTTGFFRVGLIEDESTSIGTEQSSEPIGDDGALTIQYNFTIWFPTAVYSALDADSAVRESIVRSFADNYVPTGLFYNILTY